jgi:hypothetical protein
LVSRTRQTHTNWSQVRDRIDRGEMGDKIAGEDPAAAPLGTDAEAGGSGTHARDVARSAASEQAGPIAQAAAQRRAAVPRRRNVVALVLAVAAVVYTIAVLALALAH